MQVGKMLVLFEDAGHDLRAAFDKFDRSQDGLLSISELENGLKGLGAAFEQLTRAEVEKIAIDAFDQDPDEGAHVTYEQFASFVKKARAQLGSEDA